MYPDDASHACCSENLITGSGTVSYGNNILERRPPNLAVRTIHRDEQIQDAIYRLLLKYVCQMDLFQCKMI